MMPSVRYSFADCLKRCQEAFDRNVEEGTKCVLERPNIQQTWQTHYLFLIRRDYRAMANLCPKFRDALKALAPNACLTRWERLTRARQSLLCDILTELKNDL